MYVDLYNKLQIADQFTGRFAESAPFADLDGVADRLAESAQFADRFSERLVAGADTGFQEMGVIALCALCARAKFLDTPTN